MARAGHCAGSVPSTADAHPRGQGLEDVWLPRTLANGGGAGVCAVASGAETRPAWRTLTQKASRVSPGMADEFFSNYLMLHPKIIRVDG